MAEDSSNRRDLSFKDVNEMLAEVRSLQSTGYESMGNWNLGQAASHIADWMRYPLDGFPKPPLVLRPIFWFVKVTMASGMKKKILAEGFKPGMPTAPQSVPSADAVSDEQGIAKLQESVDRVMAHDGEFLSSPLFGPTGKDTLIQVTLLHAAHHLGYLKAKS